MKAKLTLIKRAKHTKKRGAALMTTFLLMMVLTIAGASYIAASMTSERIANREQFDIETSHLAEAGLQQQLGVLWQDFSTTQNFVDLDKWCQGASASAPTDAVSGSIPGVGNFSIAVISYTKVDNFTRTIEFRSVGWVDGAGTGSLATTDPQKVVDQTATYQLARSGVFDYTYFVNNYGWMDGFGPNDLIVAGDMRANGDFNITNGSPTVNGSVMACASTKLIPVAAGHVNGAPIKWSDSTYAANQVGQTRWRQDYNSSVDGAVGSTAYMQNMGLIFQSIGASVNGQYAGAILADSTGTKSWDRESLTGSTTESQIDTNPTKELIMPDLSDISNYEALSQNYTDQLQTYQDGAANPNYGKPAYIETWDSTTNSYQTLTTAGVVSGSAAIIGTQTHPIIIHGPVTFTQDAVIKGYVSGQGTIYTGRNVQIVGSIIYSNPPNFTTGSGISAVAANQKADMLGMAANGSIIMGDTSTFGSNPLQYMTPPFTVGRYDQYGNYIPPFNATATDSTGKMLYQSTMGDAYIHSIASSVDQIDGIMYTNNCAGGNIATGGNGIKLNGSIISKDEAMVCWSLPMAENYDDRIRDQGPTSQPLIDIDLPRSPQLTQTSWHDLGFSMAP
ncbi:MAG TPA: pilus assembly PilX N-terminal domain-containing protein [Fimbriimonadaceae bacterium]|jgi:hypothetical protein